jgi:transposase
VIRVSQWSEIRHLHVNEGVGKRELARRLGLDVKTVRRALAASEAPLVRRSRPRGQRLDRWREQIEGWLRAERKLTAERIGRLLEPLAGPVAQRTVRRYVAQVRAAIYPREAFVHRTHEPGATLEADFGQSRAMVGGRLHKVHYVVGVLPASNAYYAKAYPAERLECLLDGLGSAFEFFGGVPGRLVLDNTSLAVKQIGRGRERLETTAFEAWRGGWPLGVDYCAPAKGWEKGSVEGGVKYVRNNLFRPIAQAESWEALNAWIEAELRRDMERRRLADGRTVAEALAAERERLRPLPLHRPAACRTLARVADKFGHVRVDRVTYSVPITWAYRPVVVRLFHDRVELAGGDQVLASHRRAFGAGVQVLEARHVLELLERKSRAAREATAIQQWRLPAVFDQLREALGPLVRHPEREWIGVLRLMEHYPEEAVAEAVAEALERGSPRRATIELLLRRELAPRPGRIEPAAVARADLAALRVGPPTLADYDTLWRQGA